jgi:phenylacetate-CoA ligase
VHASSGTGGKPTVVGYTHGDLDVWAEVMARCMATAGVRPGMLVHNANGYGLFTGGLGFHHGAERLGATVLPVSTGQTRRQLMLLRDLQAQVLCSTPSYAMTIADALEADGAVPRDLSLELGLFGAEPWSEAMRAQLERRLGPDGAQLLRAVGDHRPGRGRRVRGRRRAARQRGPLPRRGALDGELVITTLTKEALPLIRYRTATSRP